MNGKTLRAAAVAALLGSVPGFFACGRRTLPMSSAADVGMSADTLARVDSVIQEAIGRKELPGAVLLVARKGKTVLRKAYGDRQWVPDRKPMPVDGIFDLASITKPVATATSIMILAERGRLSLWDRVKMHIPEFVPYVDYWGENGEDARIWHLLTHTSGLPPYTDAEEARKILGGGETVSAEELVKYIAGLPKTGQPGGAFHYSCLGYITMADIIHRLTGQTIAEFAEENIFQPLGMTRTLYRAADRFVDRCVPTQVIDGRPLVGVVHDPLARLQGGISGNAGLFSTADDLAIFAQMILNKGEWKGRRILSPLAVERMTSIYPRAPGSGRGLGWDLSSAYASNGGDLFGPRSFGHTGYTGTSIWIDPETETVVILLTNSVHPDDKGQAGPLRSRVANVVAASILK
jgi:CubicO group peptidase (beta-lactamase class C family)